MLGDIGAWRMALAFMSVSALLLALSVRTSSHVNFTFCVGRTHYQCVFTHLEIYNGLRSNAKLLK